MAEKQTSPCNLTQNHVSPQFQQSFPDAQKAVRGDGPEDKGGVLGGERDAAVAGLWTTCGTARERGAEPLSPSATLPALQQLRLSQVGETHAWDPSRRAPSSSVSQVLNGLLH